jgi:hypothetical protein
MSRLMQRIRQQQEMQRLRGAQANNQATVQKLTEEAGDALELSARVALAAGTLRPRRADEPDAFWLGYITAGKEIAVVLRAMRAGEPPLPADMESARLLALEECTPDAEDGAV